MLGGSGGGFTYIKIPDAYKCTLAAILQSVEPATNTACFGHIFHFCIFLYCTKLPNKPVVTLTRGWFLVSRYRYRAERRRRPSGTSVARITAGDAASLGLCGDERRFRLLCPLQATVGCRDCLRLLHAVCLRADMDRTEP